jgi:hypothetical protein
MSALSCAAAAALTAGYSNWLVGELNTMFGQPGAGVHIAHWGAAYGGVFRRPGPFGSSDVCVLDPRAAAHILGNSDVRPRDALAREGG